MTWLESKDKDTDSLEGKDREIQEILYHCLCLKTSTTRKQFKQIKIHTRGDLYKVLVILWVWRSWLKTCKILISFRSSAVVESWVAVNVISSVGLQSGNIQNFQIFWLCFWTENFDICAFLKTHFSSAVLVHHTDSFKQSVPIPARRV